MDISRDLDVPAPTSACDLISRIVAASRSRGTAGSQKPESRRGEEELCHSKGLAGVMFPRRCWS